MIIQTIIKDDNNKIIGKRTSYNWEGANEDFGKLERMYKIELPEKELTNREICEELENRGYKYGER